MSVSSQRVCNRGHGRNTTFRRVLFSERIGDHDVHEPTLLERVYVLLDMDACQVKIGWTRNSPEERRQAWQLSTGRTLELVGSMRGGYNLERALHGRFREFRKEGREWYSSEILAELLPLLDA